MFRPARLFFAVAACAVFAAGLFFWYQADAPQVSGLPHIEIGGQTIRVMVADTPETRARGLSGHPGLADDEGMLFVFSEDDRHAFWMKDMQFAIDIIWISYSGEIVDIKENALPESYPSVFAPRREARYVVELPAGWVGEHTVAIGDIVRL